MLGLVTPRGNAWLSPVLSVITLGTSLGFGTGGGQAVGARRVGTMGDSAFGVEELASAASDSLASDMLASVSCVMRQTLCRTVGDADGVREHKAPHMGLVWWDACGLWQATSLLCSILALCIVARA